ncbi:MAG: hydantoinase/oxoprolinase family protein, partial [Pseudomonadota bacterium]
LINGSDILATVKHPTTPNIGTGIISAVETLLKSAGVSRRSVQVVMIGTTHFTNALVEAKNLDEVGVIRLASPSGEALPPLTAWPERIKQQVGDHVFLLPGGYEFDGREIAPLDEGLVRDAAAVCKARGVNSIAVSSAFAPVNSSMELRAAEIIRHEHPSARVSLSHNIGRLGIIERENGVVLNASLATLATRVVESFKRALLLLGLEADLFISQNDGTLISSQAAVRYPVMTIGSGPTNSMRGAAYLTGIRDGIVMDVGGTTCDIGALVNGMPRESSLSDDIGGIRTNFRMPDIISVGLGGGTRVHIDPSQLLDDHLDVHDFCVGPDSAGYQITEESFLFGGNTLTASDVAVSCGYANIGDSFQLPPMSDATKRMVWTRIQAILEDGIDRVKTAAGPTTIIAVGGGHFFVDDEIKGSLHVVRPQHAEVANAVGAAIAQVGAQIEQVIDYDNTPRDTALKSLSRSVQARVAEAGGDEKTIEVIDVEEVFLSYLPGRAAQIRMKAIGELADFGSPAMVEDRTMPSVHYAH